MGFVSLQRLKNRRSASRRRYLARHVPPSGFGYPLDGLLPSKPCRSCFVPAALMGFALRSLLLSRGKPAVSARLEPTYRFARRYTLAPEGAGAGSTSRGSWALTLPRVPGDPRVFSPQTTGCSLGLSLPGLLAEALTGISPDLLSRAFSRRLDTVVPAPQSLDQPLLDLIRPPGEPNG
jgi:hypothetical protein